MVPWYHGTMAPWYHGTMAPWHHGTIVPWCHGVEMREISTRMLRGRFWLENQDFGVSVGAICIIFRDTSFPTSPRSQNQLFEKLSQVSRVAEMVAAKNCSNFWGEKIVQTSGAQIQANCPRMLRGRFWLENQDFGVSVGAIGIIFRDLSVPTSPGTQIDFFEKPISEIDGAAEGVQPPGPESRLLPRGG